MKTRIKNLITTVIIAIIISSFAVKVIDITRATTPHHLSLEALNSGTIAAQTSSQYNNLLHFAYYIVFGVAWAVVSNQFFRVIDSYRKTKQKED